MMMMMMMKSVESVGWYSDKSTGCSTIYSPSHHSSIKSVEVKSQEVLMIKMDR